MVEGFPYLALDLETVVDVISGWSLCSLAEIYMRRLTVRSVVRVLVF